ncbi:hypothetical protein D3C71_2013380 [compost metagenome]
MRDWIAWIAGVLIEMSGDCAWALPMPASDNQSMRLASWPHSRPGRDTEALPPGLPPSLGWACGVAAGA